MYLAWYDASKKLTPAEKIMDAYDRYFIKFNQKPTEVLVAPGTEVNTQVGVEVVERRGIAPNTFWIGTPEEDNT